MSVRKKFMILLLIGIVFNFTLLVMASLWSTWILIPMVISMVGLNHFLSETPCPHCAGKIGKGYTIPHGTVLLWTAIYTNRCQHCHQKFNQE